MVNPPDQPPVVYPPDQHPVVYPPVIHLSGYPAWLYTSQGIPPGYTPYGIPAWLYTLWYTRLFLTVWVIPACSSPCGLFPPVIPWVYTRLLYPGLYLRVVKDGLWAQGGKGVRVNVVNAGMQREEEGVRVNVVNSAVVRE